VHTSALHRANDRHAKTEDGVDVIDEEEYRLIHKCKGYKREYSDLFAGRQATVVRVAQLKQSIADQKYQLANAFAEWYRGKYNAEIGEGSAQEPAPEHDVQPHASVGDALDDGEQFEKLELQRILDTHPESLSFYTAQKKVTVANRNKKRFKDSRKPFSAAQRPRMR
jgi:hypothetical protein